MAASTTSPIKFSGSHTEEDLVRACVLNARMSVAARLAFLALPVAAGFFTLLLALVGDYSMVAAVLFTLGFALVLRIGVPRFTARRIWKSGSLHSQPMSGEASEEGLTIERPSTRATFKWSQIRKHKMSPETVLFYLRDYDFGYLSRRLFASDSDWESFRGLVAARSPATKSGAGQGVALIGVGAILLILAYFWFSAPSR